MDYLVQVARSCLYDDRFHFLLVGDGQERAEVEDLASRCGVLGKNLSMLPRISKAEMVDVLAATDIAVSLFIPFREMENNSTNKFFDGLSAGCCMAINYGGWHSELLEEAGAGLRPDVNSEVEARQLAKFASNRARVREAGRHARALAEERFSRDKLARELEHVLVRSAGVG